MTSPHPHPRLPCGTPAAKRTDTEWTLTLDGGGSRDVGTDGLMDRFAWQKNRAKLKMDFARQNNRPKIICQTDK